MSYTVTLYVGVDAFVKFAQLDDKVKDQIRQHTIEKFKKEVEDHSKVTP